MTEKTAQKDGERGSDPSPRIITIDDLRTVDFQAPIHGIAAGDAHDYFGNYQRARDNAMAAGDQTAAAVHQMFLGICTISLQPENPGEVWVPLATLANGTRTSMPEDFAGEQTEVLAAIAIDIADPALRARIADVAWTNDRRMGGVAKQAIEAYCTVVNGLLDGTISTRHGLPAARESHEPMHRALQIAWLTTKATKRPQQVIGTFSQYFQSVLDDRDIETATRLAELALEFRLIKATDLAPKLEDLATSPSVGADPIEIRRAYDLAARLYGNARDEEARQRMLFGAVEQTLAARQHGVGAAGQAAWVHDALQRLNHVKGHEDLEVTLEAELKRLQKAGLKELGSFSVDLEIGDAPQRVAEHFRNLSLSDALKQIGFLVIPQDPEELREAARQTAKSSPFLSAISLSYLDHQGRTEAKAPGVRFTGEQDEAWYARTIDMNELMRRQHVVVACLEPARKTIHATVGIRQAHLAPIVGASLFIPPMQKEIMLLGFTRMFQGDYISSTHLLVPHLEPCLRHVLRIAGHDPANRDDDGTEQDQSLNAILSQFRGRLEQIFGGAVVQEIDRLFNSRPGPALRHELAHGQVSGDTCLTPNTIYANWFIYHLCARPVFSDWEVTVAPDVHRHG